MSDATRPTALNERLTKLEAELRELRQQLAGEVRTQRLVVTDAEGVEVITAGMKDQLGPELEVIGRRAAGGAFTASLMAYNDEAHDMVGVQLGDGESTYGWFQIIRSRDNAAYSSVLTHDVRYLNPPGTPDDELEEAVEAL